ncbi:MAG: YraN family protein [Peptococcaceae bacterium]|jgi:putative endonuclease|nr:YraN family protein [Peptococcaceae bacterium]
MKENAQKTQTDKPLANKDARKALGKQSEDMGTAWLISKGMRVLERNYRCRIGEIDLIGQMDDTLVIVEIRSRSSDSRGTPVESVTHSKRQKLRKIAAWYLAQKGREDSPCRFDVLGILYSDDGGSPQIEWITNAF